MRECNSACTNMMGSERCSCLCHASSVSNFGKALEIQMNMFLNAASACVDQASGWRAVRLRVVTWSYACAFPSCGLCLVFGRIVSFETRASIDSGQDIQYHSLRTISLSLAMVVLRFAFGKLHWSVPLEFVANDSSQEKMLPLPFRRKPATRFSHLFST